MTRLWPAVPTSLATAKPLPKTYQRGAARCRSRRRPEFDYVAVQSADYVNTSWVRWSRGPNAARELPDQRGEKGKVKMAKEKVIFRLYGVDWINSKKCSDTINWQYEKSKHKRLIQLQAYILAWKWWMEYQFFDIQHVRNTHNSKWTTRQGWHYLNSKHTQLIWLLTFLKLSVLKSIEFYR